MSTVSPEDLVLIVGTLNAIGRTGARQVEFGHLDDTEHVADARWWATAQYRGAKVSCDGQDSPAAAVLGLYGMLVAGGTCTTCGRTVALRHTTDGLVDGARMRRGRYETRRIRKAPGAYCTRECVNGEWSNCGATS